MYILFLIFGCIALLLIILVVKTLSFRPKAVVAGNKTKYILDSAALADRFVSFIKCKTVSSNNGALVNRDEFTKFHSLLEAFYPTIYCKSSPEYIGPSGLLYCIKGESNTAPTILMSHYDVVPAVEEYREKPAFEGIVENEVIWGRGTLDTKATLFGIMESLERLLKEGFIPKNDIYLAFSGDEEIAGDTAPAIVKELKNRGVRPSLVVDEGGAVVENIFPGVSKPTALIGTAEKGMLDLKLKVKSKGGHASSPPVHTPVGVLADAVVKIEKKSFKFRLTPPVRDLFDTLGRHSTFVYRLIFANLWLFSPILDLLCKKTGGEMNAMMRTTCAFTMMEGSSASNVIPPLASVGANLRIIGSETYEDAVERLKGIVKNDDIEFEVVYGMNPSPSSLVDGNGYEILSKAIASCWPTALVSPYLMFACSDSRHYHEISDYVYRFSAMQLTNEQRALIHSHNERITFNQLIKIVEFYLHLVSAV